MQCREPTPWKRFIIIGAIVQCSLSQSPGYYSYLKGLRTSYGVWDPPFSPSITEYQILLKSFVAELTIEADIAFDEYLSSEFYPTLTVNKEPVPYRDGHPAVHTIELGGTPLDTLVKEILVEVRQPSEFHGNFDAAADVTKYHLVVTREEDLAAALMPKRLVIEDDLYNLVRLQPPFKELSKHVLYHGSVPGSAKKLRLQFGCLSPATAQAQVAGTKLPSNGDSIDAWVDPDDAGETDLTIDCIWKAKG
ncbi:unnamed protein product [Durusdinium trenchii]|uniref:Uncharacterized protein n=1 Tax=Durusdinium trenchii TaxID=1381693 RepID=A0ABP0S0Y3_9DINO